MKNILNKIAVATGLCLAASSCGFLEVDPQVITSDNFYENQQEVLDGLAGVYGALNNEEVYGNNYSLMASNIDDLSYVNRVADSKNVVMYNLHSAGTSEIYNIWRMLYEGVKNANAFMDAIVQTDFDEDGKLYNEARFIRAYYHFLLAQAWGDVPLRTKAVVSHDELLIAATPQHDVLCWVAKEMDACIAKAPEELDNAPSRVVRTTIQGILARVYLFMAGESVNRGENADQLKMTYLTKARDYALAVIDSNKHGLNKDYSQVFINMIKDIYDKPSTDNDNKTESMWEVDFLGDRSSASYHSNGRIGDLIGLQNTGDQYSKNLCNYAHGMYNGSLRLWDLYWSEDRTESDDAGKVQDRRQAWNLPPYAYHGSSKPPYGQTSGAKAEKGIDKAPYTYYVIENGTIKQESGKKVDISTTEDPYTAQAIRFCGKYRREVEYEGLKTAKLLYTTINYPILRYSDVLLMYAEASNELSGPSEDAYNHVVAVRTRAGVGTKPLSDYDQNSFRELIRNERGRELCFESLRKYDLIRWGIFVEQMHKYAEWTEDVRWSANGDLSKYAKEMGTNVMPQHILLPVPSIELGVNKLLVQNPLW